MTLVRGPLDSQVASQPLSPQGEALEEQKHHSSPKLVPPQPVIEEEKKQASPTAVMEKGKRFTQQTIVKYLKN